MKIKEMNIETFNDSRASRFFDIFPAMKEQITVSKVEPNQVSGWHMHKNQTDYFFVAQGSLKISIINQSGEIFETIVSGDKPKTIKIESNHWHCYRSYESQVFLIYHLSQKHDESDEYRISEDEIFSKYNYKI